MAVVRTEIRRGVYADSIVLMQLQAALAKLPDVEDAGAVMGTAANLELLAANGLDAEGKEGIGPDDLVVVVRAASELAADGALSRIDELRARRSSADDADFRPRSLASAVRLLPQATWVLVSVPGRYAARVAREALELGRHVFLYSDNVSVEDEVALKRSARERGLLVMGPDCGTAVVGGVGLGFANRVRRGAIGLVGASGTGLQAITTRIHALGAGVSHALGTGGRDLSAEVGGTTALQAMELLARDPGTKVIVLVSKPPDPAVATPLLTAARAAGKPVVVHFLAYPRPALAHEDLHFASDLGEAAALAVSLAGRPATDSVPAPPPEADGAAPGFLRALFAGGTFALEAQQALAGSLAPIRSNVPILGSTPLDDLTTSRDHTILDLGTDELTRGRLHPMIDPDLRLRRLRREAADPETALILVDVILGHGAHPDPAAALAPTIREIAATAGAPEIAALLIGTDEDPQDLAAQAEKLRQAGALVFQDVAAAFAHIARRLAPLAPPASRLPPRPTLAGEGLAAINVGLELFAAGLSAQNAPVVHVDWRPPAGGDERLASILDRLRSIP